jgi:hypothetical protein
MKTKLTKEEQVILESFEKGEWAPVKNLSKRKAELMSYARNTLRKDSPAPHLNSHTEKDHG